MADFTPTPTGFVLELEDGADKVSFVNSGAGNFQLLDGTFVIGQPRSRELTYDASRFGREKYMARILETREIRFKIRVSGEDFEGVVSNMNRLAAMIERSQTGLSLSGGYYAGDIGYAPSYTTSPYKRIVNTGDQGLILRVRLSDQASTTPVYDTESGSAIAKNDIVSYKVYFGDWSWDSAYTVEALRTVSAGEASFNEVEVILTCSPYAVGDARVISGPLATELVYDPYPIGGTTNTTNKITVSDIPGSSPALTRISATVDGGASGGVLIARDTVNSVWNCGSVPRITSSGYTAPNILVVGRYTGVGKKIDIQLTQLNPVIFKYRVNGGTWSSTVQPNAYVRYSVGMGTGDEDLGVVFLTTNLSTGYVLNDIVYFYSHQAPIAPNGTTYNLYYNAALLVGSDGDAGKTYYVNVPRGVNNRYKLLIPLTTTGPVDQGIIQVRLSMWYMTITGGTVASYTNWTTWPTSGYWLADLGTLDLTPSGSPGRIHPGAHHMIGITVHIRTSTLITEANTMTFYPAYLVPCDGPGAYMLSKWSFDMASSYFVVSNFDMDNPYSIAMTRNPNDISTGNTVTQVFELDGTSTGDYITLLPGVDNTILAVGLYGPAGVRDYRGCIPGDTLYDFMLAIRPRYLFVGS